MSVISICGTGWLGTALAKQLVVLDHELKVATRTSRVTIADDRLSHFNIDLSKPQLSEKEDQNWAEFFDADILYLLVPFKRDLTDPWDYYQWIERALKYCQKSKKKPRLILSTSTSIYPNKNEKMTEDSAIDKGSDRATVLAATEAMVLAFSDHSLIVRIGGMVGEGRNSLRTVKKEGLISRPQSPVNLIHQEDCVRVLSLVLENPKVSGLYNLVTDEHPSREEYYSSVAKAFDCPIPQFDHEDTGRGKWVSNEKLKADFGYSFRYPSPLAFFNKIGYTEEESGAERD